ncbi:hypothetical protein F6X38_05380 [Aureimonas leprariae]|uniref:Uncharacterized protein n=1 Tax=Plantimonas leprariae TaxID=2615207 RepID=A0A7V7PRF3_9HYPH|nr:hypothetical protein F6X38_05380 [Aureimonas leprariae]
MRTLTAFIAGICVLPAISLFLQFADLAPEAIWDFHRLACQPDEPGIACGREWAGAIASVAGAATIVFLIKQLIDAGNARRSEDRWNREIATLQTLEVRSTIDAISIILGRLRSARRDLRRNLDFLDASPRESRRLNVFRQYATDLYRVGVILHDPVWERLFAIDGEARDRLLNARFQWTFALDIPFEQHGTAILNTNVPLANFIHYDNLDLLERTSADRLLHAVGDAIAETEELIAAVTHFRTASYFRERAASRAVENQMADEG